MPVHSLTEAPADRNPSTDLWGALDEDDSSHQAGGLEQTRFEVFNGTDARRP